MLRLISVTPRGMLSWLQPESAWAAGKPDAAATARASGASFAQIIVTCLTARTPTVAGGASQQKKADQLRLKALGLRPGGRHVDAADETLQPKRQPTPLLFREKAAQLALAAVRLNGEPARVLLSCGAAQFNLRPMPREHDP